MFQEQETPIFWFVYHQLKIKIKLFLPFDKVRCRSSWLSRAAVLYMLAQFECLVRAHATYLQTCASIVVWQGEVCWRVAQLQFCESASNYFYSDLVSYIFYLKQVKWLSLIERWWGHTMSQLPKRSRESCIGKQHNAGHSVGVYFYCLTTNPLALLYISSYINQTTPFLY